MKKFLGIILTVIAAMFVLAACEFGDPVDLSKVPREVSVEVGPSLTDYPTNSTVDSLDLTGAKLKVTYVDNSVESIDITKDMLDDSKVDWTKPGAQTINVVFGTEAVSFTTKLNMWLYAPWSGAETTDWYDTAKTSFTLDTADKVAGFAALVREGNIFSGKTVILGHDMDLSDSFWKGIGASGHAFSGTFDGNGKTVSGLKMDAAVREDAAMYNGFFYAINGGAVKNLNLIDVDIKTHGWTGALAGHISDTTVSGVTVSGKIAGSFTKDQFVKGRQNGSAIAGIVEYAIGGSVIINSTSDVTLTNNFDMSGIDFDGYAAVTAYAGGIVCELNNSSVVNCTNNGAISSVGSGYIFTPNNIAFAQAGGITAYIRYISTIDSCINNGAVSTAGFGYTSAAGIAAYLWGDTIHALTIKNTVNNGAISADGSDAYAGGIGAEAYSMYAGPDGKYFSAKHIVTGNANNGAVAVKTDSALTDSGNPPAVGGILGWADRAVGFDLSTGNANNGALSFSGRDAGKGNLCGKTYTDEELVEWGYVFGD